ncbi:MAG: glycosyltransferase, partial [Kiritimatiellae bacterium]|nr:glycosyltransferase [Kiritimatiellia bacterium]
MRDRFAQVLPYPVSIVRQPNFHRPTRPHPFSREFQQAILAGTPFEAALAKYLKHPRSVALLNFHWEQTNFGALLTSFALSRYVADIGWRPQNIDYSPINADHVAMRANDGFESFRRRHLPRTRKFTDGRTLCSLAKWFNTFIVGSDQVWAKRITGGREDAFFLSFAGPGKRLISAAASFGRVSASEWDAEELKTRLEVFSAISVREREDAQTVKSLIGKGECVPDPVFWVEPSVWHGLADEACRKIDGAIAVYCVNRDETAGLLKFLELSGLTTPEKPARVLSSSLTPEEWLYAIRSAKLVVTDSFHGTCFSILFHTPFVCIHANEPRSVRHRTLLENLGLSNHLFRDGGSAFLSYRGGMAVDWAGVDGKISQYREQGRKFIAAALATDDMASPEMAAAWSRLKAYRKAHPSVRGGGLPAARRKAMETGSGSDTRRETVQQTLARLKREPPAQPESPGISVVMPIYNAEKYIDDCLASLFTEDVPPGVEILCIDDGSTDGTVEHLRGWAEAAHNIRIIEQTNQGPGVARNVGIDAAKGEYIVFLDADDRLSSGASLKALYERAVADKLDMLVCGSNQMAADGTVLRRAYLNESVIPNERVFGPKALGKDLYRLTPQNPWSKLYRREFLISNKLSFPPLRRAEDFAFVQLTYALAKRIGVSKDLLVDHRIGVGTSCESTKDETPLLFLEGEAIFRDSMKQRGLWRKFKAAADVSSVRRLAYNIGAVREFASFNAIAQKLDGIYRSLKKSVSGKLPPDVERAVELVEKVVSAARSKDQLVDLFLVLQSAEKVEKSKFDSVVVQLQSQNERIAALDVTLNDVRAKLKASEK